MACPSTDVSSNQLSSTVQIVSQPNNNVPATAEVSAPESTEDYSQLKAVSSTQHKVNSSAKYTEKELRIVLQPIDSVYTGLRECRNVDYTPSDSPYDSAS